MLDWTEILLRLFLACLFGSLIGLERERKHWAAGLRTHMLVCVGSCLIMIVSAFGFYDILGTDKVMLDPSRIAAQVISGIGFIGAGTILLLKQGAIRGLTTASGLWTIAAIGLATGGGLYFAAGATTLTALVILWALKPLEQMYFKKYKEATLEIIANHTISETNLLSGLFGKDDDRIQSISLKKNNDNLIYQIKLENMDITKLDALTKSLKDNKSIIEFFWQE